MYISSYIFKTGLISVYITWINMLSYSMENIENGGIRAWIVGEESMYTDQ